MTLNPQRIASNFHLVFSECVLYRVVMEINKYYYTTCLTFVGYDHWLLLLRVKYFLGNRSAWDWQSLVYNPFGIKCNYTNMHAVFLGLRVALLCQFKTCVFEEVWLSLPRLSEWVCIIKHPTHISNISQSRPSTRVRWMRKSYENSVTWNWRHSSRL